MTSATMPLAFVTAVFLAALVGAVFRKDQFVCSLHGVACLICFTGLGWWGLAGEPIVPIVPVLVGQETKPAPQPKRFLSVGEAAEQFVEAKTRALQMRRLFDDVGRPDGDEGSNVRQVRYGDLEGVGLGSREQP